MMRIDRSGALHVFAAVAALTLAMVPNVWAQVGKCCLPDGRGCRDLSEEACAGVGGVFIAGEVCAHPDDTCEGPAIGACCRATGCEVIAAGECEGGLPFFPNAACAPDPCMTPITGACCEEFQCRITIAVDCQSPGAVFHAGTGCVGDLCGTAPTGACCRGGQCAVTTRLECINGGAGGEWFEDQVCGPSICRLGSCCISPTSCVIVTQGGCELGLWEADGVCVQFFCVLDHGTCCREDGRCVVTVDFDCENGSFMLGNVCANSPCGGMGACCSGTNCQIVGEGLCPAGSTYQGNGTACGPDGNPTTCCPANFNQSGGVTVQDIFDFLAAYFASDPGADFNQVGGITVQDIFDFLAAYFAGCP